MINGITIENFKGVRDEIRLDLHPITLLFGANSAGKSSVLHAFQYFHEILENRNFNPQRLGKTKAGADVGGFQSFVHGRRPDRKQVKIGVSFSLKGFELPRFQKRTLPELDEPDSLYERPKVAYVQVSVAWSELLEAAYVARYAIEFDGLPFANIHFEPGTLVSELSINENHPCLKRDIEHSWLAKWQPLDSEQLDEERSVLGQLMDWANHNYVVNQIREGQEPYTSVLGVVGQKDALPSFISSLSLDADWEWSERDSQAQQAQLPELADHLTEVLSQLILGPGHLVKKQLATSRFVGPIRKVPDRSRTPSREQTVANWATGLTAWERLESGDDNLVDAVNSWLADEDRLNSGYFVNVKKFKELDLSNPLVVKLVTGRAFDEVEDGTQFDITKLPTQLRLVLSPSDPSPENDEIDLAPSDVGIGISQVVPVLVATLDGKNSLVSIEQPELHVHPRLQAEIGDIFLDGIHEHGHQFILETHSEHLILRLLRRIRETERGKVPPHRQLKTSDLAIYYLQQNSGCTSAKKIDVDVKGDFIQPWPDDFFEIDFNERFGIDKSKGGDTSQ
jgi:hypothetical protein